MDLQLQRMECLKMAFELGGKTDPIVTAAQQLLDFVAGKQAQAGTEAPAEPAITVTTPEEQVASTLPEKATEAPSADVIAACGTVLVLPEGGDLADAIPSTTEQETTPPQAGGTEPAEAPIQIASEPEARASEQPSPDGAPEQSAAPDPVQTDAGEISASDVRDRTGEAATEQTEAPSEASTNPEKEVGSEEATLVASAPADAPHTV
jgi:hypothetical protein